MNNALTNIWTVFKRELKSHFNSMLAYVFIIIFVVLAMVMTFLFGRFLERGDASLESQFFFWHPWLFMLLGPAVGMRLWSEENRTGTVELLLTMPIATWHAILGKFLAACTVIFLALFATFPIVITLFTLGDPDVGPIFVGYLASFLVAATYVAVTCAVSAFTRSLVTCLVVSVAICLSLTLLGFPMTTDFFADYNTVLASFLSLSSPMGHFLEMIRGVVTLNDVVFYASIIGFCLFLTSVVIRSKRA